MIEIAPAQLWKTMSDEQRVAAATAFWHDEQSLAEQAEVVGLIARKINFRPKSVLAMPAERKAQHLARMGKVSDLVAARLLVSYHLAHQRPMMAAFLDALGIAHEDGLINDEHLAKPADDALATAVTRLRDAYPSEDVRLYFTTLLLQDPETWGGLEPYAEDAPDPPIP
jgi:hypothetical protein